MTSDRFDRNGIVRLFEGDSNHMLAKLGILFSTTADNAESDGCDEYWWRTAGLTAVIREIDRRLALQSAAPVPPVEVPDADLRERLLEPELAYDISSELFLNGYEDEDRDLKGIPALAIGAVIGHLFGECRICAAGEVRKRIKQDQAEYDAAKAGGAEG